MNEIKNEFILVLWHSSLISPDIRDYNHHRFYKWNTLVNNLTLLPILFPVLVQQKNNMPSGESEKVDELNEKLDVFARDLKHGYKIS